MQFDLRVNDGVAAGTVISNQATVRSVEVPILLTDGDGNPATGPEPTIVVVGNGQQLSITKQVAVVGGGPATAGGQLEYIVRVTNVSTVPALVRRHHGRPRHERAGLPDVRRPVGDAEWLGQRASASQARC